jgi:Uma2 family endonuclease
MSVTKSIDIAREFSAITSAQFQQLCEDNPDWRLELTAKGQLVIMAPTGWDTSKQNGYLSTQVWLWNDLTKLGEVFDSSGGFTLPNGAIKSPDVTWIATSKLEGISIDVAFPIVVPDFVIELRSSSDRLQTLQDKMLEYRDNGVSLGLLLNRKERQVEIYRLGKEIEILDSPSNLDCGDILPGFSLELTKLW